MSCQPASQPAFLLFRLFDSRGSFLKVLRTQEGWPHTETIARISMGFSTVNIHFEERGLGQLARGNHDAFIMFVTLFYPRDF